MPLREKRAFPVKHDRMPAKAGQALPAIMPLPRPLGRRPRRPMTVCIAAMCTWQAATPTQVPILMIVGASDRLITVGDIEFEPFQQKIYQFSSHIVALVAGDSQAQISICDATRARFAPHAPSSVEEAANVYAEELAKYRRKHAEAKYLMPIGLDVYNFTSSPLAGQLAFDMTNARLEVETIITGMDSAGFHIFIVLDPGIVRCSDSVGFAAIGMGQRHAESAFMFQRYSRSWAYQRALLLTYVAKKRAEIAPGIGATTDFFFIGINGFQRFYDDIIKEIDATYQELDGKARELVEEAGKRIDKSVPAIVERNLQAQPPAQGKSDASSGKPQT